MKISKNVKAVLEIVACIMVVIAAAKYANEFEKFVIIMVIGFAVILYDKIWFGLKSVMKWK